MVAELREFLLGDWRLERRITDRHSGGSSIFQGVARFSDAADGLAYHETGNHRLGAEAMIAERRYLYAFPNEGPAEVRFADGRPFHQFDLLDEAFDVRHVCGSDLYDGSFRRTGPQQWEATWNVLGPNKDYTSTTVYNAD